MTTKEVLVPDIGEFKNVDVIEVLVKAGDDIAKDDPLITLETDKAAMDIPAPESGKIAAMNLKVGDKVSQGSLILTIDIAADGNKTNGSGGSDSKPASAVASSDATVQVSQPVSQSTEPVAAPAAISAPTIENLVIPDLGDSKDVTVIEVLVAAGDKVEAEDTLITLESDKASMDIPTPSAGTIKTFTIKVGDKVKTGAVIGTLETSGSTSAAANVAVATPAPTPSAQQPAAQQAEAKITATAQPSQAPTAAAGAHVYAGPAVRRFARELGVDLTKVSGTGIKRRILKTDVTAFVKQAFTSGTVGATGGSGLPQMPEVDFSEFGEIDVKPLSRIKKITAENLHRNWVLVPHVTQFAEADITEMEAFRKSQKDEATKYGIKLTPLVFIMKAVVVALKTYPQFNTSLAANGKDLVYKKYFHIGVAVDTPNGLVVPVVRDVDSKSLFQLAQELGDFSIKAREGKLDAKSMKGSSFTISSLGGIGGTAFTPIVNAPDVAILGVSKAAMKPVYQGGQFVPRLMLPLSLSYDHRVIDGAEAARFANCLSEVLADIRKILL